jgi:hypothetical protein
MCTALSLLIRVQEITDICTKHIDKSIAAMDKDPNNITSTSGVLAKVTTISHRILMCIWQRPTAWNLEKA